MSVIRSSAVLIAVVLSSSYLQAQQLGDGPTVTPCIQQNGAQHCSEPSLQAAFSTAASIAIESGPRDHIGESQLRSFVAKAGKSVALNTDSADLALKLTPIEQSGVNYGAADRELAKLDVYAPVGPARRQQLIWVETLSGPVDLTWPAAVARLIEQFRHRASSH